MVHGWRDAELHALLQLLREHMTHYIYSTDEDFARLLKREPEMRDQKTRAIMDNVRELMNGLSFAMKTRNFRTEAILVEDEYIYPSQYLYETMVVQPENKKGGVWDPDDLRAVLKKMETYRYFFDANPELFFARIQIWGKNVPDTRTKFYLWREIYHAVKEKPSRTEAEHLRIRCLAPVFQTVPPASSPAPTTPSPSRTATLSGSAVVTPATPSVSAAKSTSGKLPKVRKWTPEDLELFVELLVEMTLDLQNKGSSPLVRELGQRMNRTIPSLVSKVHDIRLRFEKRAPYFTAAQIPSIIEDETSVAHKIFSADWTDRGDPYALAIFKLKDANNRAINDRNRGKGRPPPLRMEMRQRHAASSPSATAMQSTPKPVPTGQQPKPGIHPISKSPKGSSTSTLSGSAIANANSKPPRVPTTSKPAPPVYSEFVRDCAAMVKRDEDFTHRLCATLRSAMTQYDTTPIKTFYADIAAAMGEKQHHTVALGERILRLCKTRYGSLDCFAAAVEGTNMASEMSRAGTTASRVELVLPSPAAEPTESSTPSSESPAQYVMASPSPDVRNMPARDARAKPTQPSGSSIGGGGSQSSIGKSNETAMHLLQQKKTRVSPSNDQTESSPSVHQYSPDHYEFDYEPDLENDDYDEHDTNHGGCDDDNAKDEPEEEEEEVEEEDGETQSLASSAAMSTDRRAPPDRNARAGHHGYDQHHFSARGKVHVTSSKTLLVRHAPSPCYCDDCERKAMRRLRGHHSTGSRKSIHRKRSRSELVAYSRDARWVDGRRDIHHVAHKRVHYQPHDSEYDDDDEHDDSDDDGMRAEVNARELARLDSMWADLMAPIEKGIVELEAKRREQREREQDRERQQRKKQWKHQIHDQVRAEWGEAAAKASPTPSGNRDAAGALRR